MNDIRRTILWVIFGFSMVLLWDQWQIHNGNKATFFPSTPVPPAATAKGPASSVPAAVPASTVPATTRRGHDARRRAPGHHGRAGAGRAEGGRHHRPAAPDLRHRRRLAGAQRIPHPGRRHQDRHLRAAGRQPRPQVRGRNRPDRRRLPDPQDGDERQRRPHAERRRERAGRQVRVARQGRREAGQDLHVQARRLRSGRAPRDRQHGHRARLAAAVPAAGARRQQAARRVVVLFHLHRPGRVHRSQEIPQDRLRRHRKGQGRDRQGIDQRLRRDGAALLRQRLDPARGHEARAVRAQGRHQPVRHRHDRAAGRHRPRRQQGRGSEVLRRPADRNPAGKDLPRPGAGQGLRLAHHPGQAAVLAAGRRSTRCCTTGAGRSWRWCW